MRKIMIVAVGLLTLAACSSEETAPPDSAGIQSTTAAPSSTIADTTSTTTTVARETAGQAFTRQIQFLSDGQFSRAYAEIHPDQQAMFTADQYERCGPGARSIEVSSVEVIEEYPETVVIPGTDHTVDATAVTAKVTVNGQTSTDTYREIDLDGRWVFTVIDPDELIAC